ncbi:YIP1 family protein [Kitasatospora sp. NBC_01287]|uniref:Yip1 family protein n=1 Tax=Kitasatospora sp. NBC_01287 TaxID=2903573 RepID=UPI0022544690|nr:YIP1 family protein [Kitasatospora sp. NBC_01287]MCX4747548.1 YIP1 family protein [Kitasatospora sp. NBC_01287]
MAGNGYLSGSGWGGGERDHAAPAAAYEPTEPYGVDPYRADQPGHTRAFAVDPAGQPLGESPGEPYYYGEQPQQGYRRDQPEATYPDATYPDAPAYGQQPPWSRPAPRSRAQGRPESPDHVATYRAGGRTAPRTGGPRLRWRELLAGLYRSPTRTFDQMRDHQVWLTTITVSLLYAVLAVLGFGDTHDEVVNSTFPVAAWSLFGAALVFTLAGLMLGSVTYALARQLGGDGPWASTVGLSVLLGWTSDAPRLVLALFLPSDNVLVQAVGWATWAFFAVLLTTLVRRVHDLPWGKAAGAASLQLLALLVLIKLPTLG